MYYTSEILGIPMTLRLVPLNGHWIVNLIGDNSNKKYFVARVYDP